MKWLIFLATSAALAGLPPGYASTPPVPAFTAHYAVNKDGSRVGDATLTLQREGDDWVYATTIQGTSGLASLLNFRLVETSRFRWRDRLPELISFDYLLDSAFKHRKRQVRVDNDEVSVSSDKQHVRYAAVPGLVERHSMILALAAALNAGSRNMILSVATRKRVEQQHYIVAGHETVSVPAGKFVDAVHVHRVGRDHGISAWFAAEHCPVPVKLAQDNSDTQLQLLSCQTHAAQ